LVIVLIGHFLIGSLGFDVCLSLAL